MPITRTEAPDLRSIDRLDIRNYHTRTMPNGTLMYYVTGLEQELIRMEMVFHGGRWYEPQQVVSRTVCNLMRKGTTSKTGKQIADSIDFYGAQLEVSGGQDFTSLVIYCLNKHLPYLLPIAEEILNDAAYREDELEMFIQRQKQKLRINAQNTDFHANRKFNAVLFGEEHPYGYSMTESKLDTLQRDTLLDYHRKHYNPGDAVYFVSGNVSEGDLDLIEQTFGKYAPKGKIISATDKSIHTDPQHKFFIDKDDSVQSSVRIGTISISKTHPDFPDLNVLNTLFGGYFGSRLMTNIREDKGYTYGIYSSISHYRHASYFSIDTEVGNEVCASALEEIYKEMDLLKTVPVDKEELTIVQNYMMGGLLRATDGPFNRINVVKNMVMSGLDARYFDGLVSAIRNITSERLMELANRYFDHETMKEVVCGKR